MVGRQAGFRNVEERPRELSAQGDPLEKLAATVDVEIFRAELSPLWARRTARVAAGRRSSRC
jgi:hypothetical protein